MSIWKNSTLNTKILNNSYLESLGQKNLIVEHKWVVSGGGDTNMILLNAKKAYDEEMNKTDFSNIKCFDEEQNQVTCNDDDRFYTSKVALIYVNDYYYAADSHYWSYPGYDGGVNDYRFAASKNWLAIANIITLTKTSWTNKVYLVYGVLCVHYNYGIVNGEGNSIIPTFYLNSNVKLVKGAGTLTNPYYIS